MAREVHTRLIDDLDGSDATGTVRFGLEGAEYEVDLSVEHLEDLEKFLAPYITHGRRLRRELRRGRSRGEEQRAKRDLGAIRQWAREQGYEVSNRGRIAGEILARYDEAH